MSMFFVLKSEDIDKHLTPNYRRVLGFISRRVARRRESAGKTPVNRYIVNNVDEPFIDEIVAVMRKHGKHISIN